MKKLLYICPLIIVTLAVIVGSILIFNNDTKSSKAKKEVVNLTSKKTVTEVQPVKEIVYDNMTIDELTAKINRSLNSTIAGYGNLYASYALAKGVDPYLAVAISLYETGCTWECSRLVKACNNVGGQAGSPRCNGGSYRAYDTLEDGIKGFIDNLADNYISKGLTTPELINTKYSASSNWAKNVNAYIERIKAK